MYTKTKEINQYFNIKKCEINPQYNNSFEFSDNGQYQFENSSFIAFKKLNSYIDKTSHYIIELSDSILKIYNNTEKYCFQIKNRVIETFSKQETCNLFAHRLVKKYAKYFKEDKDFLKVIQYDNKLIMYTITQVLELHDSLFENNFYVYNGGMLKDYENNPGYKSTTNLLNKILSADYSQKYFEIHKAIDYGKLTIDIENSIVYNQEKGQKASIKSSENFTFTKDVHFCEKVFNNFTGKKIFVNQENSGSNFLKAEHKNFNVYCFAQK